MRHTFVFARKLTNVRCEMFIFIYIKKQIVHMSSLFLKDANLKLQILTAIEKSRFSVPGP